MYYQEYGTPNKPTLVLVHGFTGSGEGFQYLIPYLEKTFHIVVPDIPGFGKSKLTDASWSIEGQADALNVWVQQLNLSSKPYVVSHSMGGLVANEMLRTGPQLYQEKTIFISPPATKSTWSDGRKIGALLNELLYTAGSYVPVVGPALVTSTLVSRFATLLMLHTKDKARRKEIYRHHIDNLHHISSIELYRRLFRDISRRGVLDSPDHLQTFSVEIITGDADNVTPLRGEKQLAHVTGAHLTVLHSTGHLAHYEQPEEITRAIIEFLQQ